MLKKSTRGYGDNFFLNEYLLPFYLVNFSTKSFENINVYKSKFKSINFELLNFL